MSSPQRHRHHHLRAERSIARRVIQHASLPEVVLGASGVMQLQNKCVDGPLLKSLTVSSHPE